MVLIVTSPSRDPNNSRDYLTAWDSEDTVEQLWICAILETKTEIRTSTTAACIHLCVQSPERKNCL